jgi:hypothetical protein
MRVLSRSLAVCCISQPRQLAPGFPIPSDPGVQVGVANRIGVADLRSDGRADDRSNRLPHAAADRAADAAADDRAERGAHPRDR